MKEKEKNVNAVLVQSMLYGSLTAFASLPFEHPLDALKTNMQSNQTKTRQTIRMMLQKKGWRAFYNGYVINSARVFLKQAYRWPLWISISNLSKKTIPVQNQLIRQTFIAISISCCEMMITCPFQRLKIWLMTTNTQEQTKIRRYFHENNKFTDLYTGFTPLLARQALSWASFLTSSEIFKNIMKQYQGLQKNQMLSNTTLFCISLPVALINTIFIMPVDCIKTFYQDYEGLVKSKNLSFFQFLGNSFQDYGLKGLYLGWQARIVQYMIQSAFTLIVIEELHYEYEKASSKVN